MYLHFADGEKANEREQDVCWSLQSTDGQRRHAQPGQCVSLALN